MQRTGSGLRRSRAAYAVGPALVGGFELIVVDFAISCSSMACQNVRPPSSRREACRFERTWRRKRAARRASAKPSKSSAPACSTSRGVAIGSGAGVVGRLQRASGGGRLGSRMRDDESEALRELQRCSQYRCHWDHNESGVCPLPNTTTACAWKQAQLGDGARLSTLRMRERS